MVMVGYVIHLTSVGKTWYHSDHIGKEYTVELIISYEVNGYEQIVPF